MAIAVADRVKETTTTTGTGTYTLAGAVTGFQSFAVIGNGNTTFYAITNGTDWEVGIGTYTASGTTLARTSVLKSSNSNNAVNWPAGTKTIWCDSPAARSILGLTTAGVVTADGSGGVTSTAFDAFPAMAVVHSGSTAALRVTQTGSGDALRIEDDTNPDSTPTVIDASGNFIVGYTAALSLGGITPAGLVVGGDNRASLGIAHYVADANGPRLLAAKSRGSIGSHGIVSSGDILWELRASGSDGTNYIRGAQIAAEVDGTPGTNDMPGRIRLLTTPDGSATPVERVRIDNAGRSVLGGAAAQTFAGSITPGLQRLGADGNLSAAAIARYEAAAGGATLIFGKSRNASVGSHTIVQSGDTIGSIDFAGSDGSNFDLAAQIVVEVGGTPGSGTDMPGLFRFKVSPDGSATPADALVINANKTLQMPAYGAGTLTSDGSGNITSVSDARLKDVIGPFVVGLSAVLALEPVSYRWNEASRLNREAINVGFIAQDVEQIIPEAVGMNDNGMRSFNDRPVIAALVNAVKELAVRVATLEKAAA